MHANMAQQLKCTCAGTSRIIAGEIASIRGMSAAGGLCRQPVSWLKGVQNTGGGVSRCLSTRIGFWSSKLGLILKEKILEGLIRPRETRENKNERAARANLD